MSFILNDLVIGLAVLGILIIIYILFRHHFAASMVKAMLGNISLFLSILVGRISAMQHWLWGTDLSLILAILALVLILYNFRQSRRNPY